MTGSSPNDLGDWVKLISPYLSNVMGAAVCVIGGVLSRKASVPFKVRALYFFALGLFSAIGCFMLIFADQFWPSIILLSGVILGFALAWGTKERSQSS